MKLLHLFDEASARKASDIHLATGERPRIRVDGALVALEEPALDRDTMSEILRSFLSADAIIRLEKGHAVEKSVAHNGLTFTAIAFRAGDDNAVVTFRILVKAVPSLAQIGDGALSFWQKVIDLPRGLVLVCGPVASGKWTTVCSLIEEINATKPARLFVIERHPSYQFESKTGLVTQLHVGEDCGCFATALQTIHQADLDVVALDDLPKAETLRQALILAETGHLVIANLHAETVQGALQKLIDAAGSEAAALRRALARCLAAVTVQRLISRTDRPGRVAAYEWIVSTPNVQQAILAGSLDRLGELQKTEPESRSIHQALDDLVQSGLASNTDVELHRASIR